MPLYFGKQVKENTMPYYREEEANDTVWSDDFGWVRKRNDSSYHPEKNKPKTLVKRWSDDFGWVEEWE